MHTYCDVDFALVTALYASTFDSTDITGTVHSYLLVIIIILPSITTTDDLHARVN